MNSETKDDLFMVLSRTRQELIALVLFAALFAAEWIEAPFDEDEFCTNKKEISIKCCMEKESIRNGIEENRLSDTLRRHDRWLPPPPAPCYHLVFSNR